MNTTTQLTIKDILQLGTAELSDGILKSQLQRHRNKGVQWQTAKKSGIIHICYDTIPAKFKEKYGLPSAYADAFQKLEAAKKQQASPAPASNKVDAAEQADIYAGMLEAVDKESIPCYNAIKGQYPEILDVKKVAQYARRKAAMDYIRENYKRNAKGELQMFFACYSKVCPDHVNPAKATAYNSFGNLVSKIMRPEADIAALAVDMKSVVKVQERTHPFVKIELANLFVSKNNYKCAAAYRELVKECAARKIPCPKESTIKALWREMKLNPHMIGERYGEAERRKHEGYLSFKRAEYRNEQWQADGKVLPFFVADKEGKGVRWTVFLVMDNRSRKVVGYALGERENTELIMAGLEEAVRNTGVWPKELVMDKHSYARTESAAITREYVESIGGSIHQSINPQSKPVVERYNQYLDDIWREYPHWLGKGVKSKSPDDRPKPEDMAEAIKPANYKTPDELLAIVVNSIEEHNNRPLSVLDGRTPNEEYAASDSRLAFVIPAEERPILFCRSTTYKVDREQINIKVGKKKYEFKLPAALIDEYNNRAIGVRYEDLTQGIYLYDVKTGEALGMALPKRKISSVYSSQTDEEKQEVNRTTGRKKGAVNRGRKQVQEIKDETMLANPDIADGLPPLPKDIKEQLMSNPTTKREYMVQGGNVNMLQSRPETKEPVKVKSKMHPFAQVSTGKMEIYDPLGHLK